MKVLVSFAFLFMTTMVNAGDFGTYIGDVVAKWSVEDRTMTLVEPFAFIDPAGVKWDAPKGSVVDGASIPRFAWTIIGGPFDDKYRASSVIHDVACVEKKRPWAYVHQTFYNGMMASGVPKVQAKIMYAAVYHFGPRWPEKKELKYKSLIKTPTMICGNTVYGSPTCSAQQEIKQIENTIVVEEPAEEKNLTEDEFKALREEIERKEKTDNPLTLTDIRDFK